MMRVLMRQAPQDARDAWGPSAVLGVLSVLAGVLPVLGSVPTAAAATHDAPLMRHDAPQVDAVRQTQTRLVQPCPKWCTEDHTRQAGEDRAHHAGTVRELRLPDGRLALEASLTREPGKAAAELVVSGSLDAFTDDVQLLDAGRAQAFAADVQRFASHVARMAATVENDRPQPRPEPVPAARPNRKERKRLPPELQGCSRETSLYLAERDGMQCFYCRRPFASLAEVTKDHYVPKSLWACNLPANLVLACEPCNMGKGDRLTWSMAAVLLAHADRWEVAA